MVSNRRLIEGSFEKESLVVKAFLDKESTKLLLHQVPRAYKTQINDILLSALVLAYGDMTGDYAVSIYIEKHGREKIHEDIDLFRTVGWFTYIFPITLGIKNPNDLGASIKSVKNQLLEVPSQGISYWILRYLGGEKEELEHEPQIVFNYLGQTDRPVNEKSFLKNALEYCGPCSHPKNKNSYPLEIEASIKENIFEIKWKVNERDEIKKVNQFSENYIERLKEIIRYCTQNNNFGYTVSDFPLAELEQEKLDCVFGKIKGIEDIYPLSPLQSGLLFHSITKTESDAYTVQTLYKMKGNISKEKLKSALEEINRYYPIFRTGFSWENISEPLQFVLKESTLDWHYESWHHLSTKEQNTALKRLLKNDRELKFNLSKPPLSRWYYIKLSENRSCLLWTHHHILLDGWSGSILLSQLLSVYQQIVEDKDICLEYASPYKGYIQYLKKHSNKNEKNFWAQYLKDSSPNILTNKVSLRNEEENSYQCKTFKYSQEDTKHFKLLAKKLKITLNTLIQGAWSLLLQHYTHNNDVIFGVTVSGRNISLEKIDKSVGLFINTLPIRVKIDENQNIIDFFNLLQLNMASVNDMVYSSLAHVKSYANQHHQEIFNTILIFENFPFDQKKNYLLSDIKIEKIEAFEKIEYSLNIIISIEECLSFNVGFQTSFFDEEGVSNILNTLVSILKRINSNIDGKISDLLESASETEKEIISEWNKTECEFVKKSLPQVYDQIASSSPDKVAVRYLNQELTYYELNYVANKIASYLRQTGLAKQTPVGVCLERSIDSVVVMLAVLKAGGHYLPLDPDFPKERLQYMLEDSGTKILLTSTAFVDRLKDMNCLVENLDDLKEVPENDESTILTYDNDPEDLAYVIYTSGSTGKPKGVMITHRGLMNFLNSIAKKPGIGKEDKLLAVTTTMFDISGLEIWLPLLNEAELIIAPKSITTNGEELGKLIETSGTTMMQATPATWQMLFDSGWKSQRSLKLLSGGDILPSKTASFLLEGGHQVWNMYGPTETTIWSTTTQVMPDSIISIGKPIDNTQIYILDNKMNQVGIGITGELYIGGAGLARGYANNSSLTKEKFIQNPFSSDRQSRLYKTGDLARYLEDGSIQYLGRLDHQIKLRGYRIEPREIEASIEKQRDVKSCVVVVSKDKEDNESLVAYLSLREKIETPSHMEEKAADALRNGLRQKLPDYMIPNYFIVLNHLPLNANGKVDRSQLPSIKDIAWDQKKYFEKPKTETEKIIYGIWRKILIAEEIGVHDNFFYLGGDSIAAIKLSSRARQEGLSISVNQIFQFPTISELAFSIEKDRTSSGFSEKKEDFTSLPSVPEKDFLDQLPSDKNAQDAYPLSPMQEAFVYMSLSQKTREANFIQNLYEIKGEIDKKRLQEAWRDLFQKAAILRTGFYYDEKLKNPIQYVCKELSLPWIEYDLCLYGKKEQKIKIEEILREDIDRGFHLDSPPLVRLLLMKLTDKSYYLTISYHHIIMDGWCVPVLIEEIKKKYRESFANKDSIMSDSTVPYQFYIDWLTKQDKEKAKDFWHTNLKGFLEPTYLELGRGKTQNATYAYDEFRYSLTSQKTRTIASFARRCAVSLNTLMQVSWAFLIYHYTKKTDVLFGVTVSGRSIDLPGVDKMLGLCINTVPLRIQIKEDENFQDLLVRTQKNMSEIQENAYLSLAQIRNVSELEGGLPLFDSIFVFENYPKIENKPKDLDVSFVSALSRGEYPLGLTVVPGNKLLFKFDYGKDHFRSDFIKNLAQNLEKVVMSLLEDN